MSKSNTERLPYL